MSVAPVLQWLHTPRRIAVFRASRPSGLLRSVPALRALREAFPEASITLVGTKEAEVFVQRFHHYLDDLLVFPGLPSDPETAAASNELPRFYAEANSRKFDVAIQLQDSDEAWNRIVARLGAPRWAGFVPEDAPASMGTCRNRDGSPAVLVPWPKHLPEILRYTELIQHLGIAVNSTELELPLTQSDHEEATHLFRATGLNPRQTVVLHPGVVVPEEGWPVERYAHLAQELVAHGWQIAITGHENDRPTTQRLRAAMRCLAVNLTGTLSGGSFAAMLAKCRLLVCSRPSVSHVAAAVHTPSIVLASGNDRNRWLIPNTDLHTVLWQPACETAQGQPGGTQDAAAGNKVCAIDVERVLLHARYKLGLGGSLV